MKYLFTALVAFTFLMSSCGSSEDFPKADNALVAAQYFLNACNKGDFKQAAFYIQPDSTNKAQLKALEKVYYKNTSDERVEYRSANIIVENDENVTQQIEIITYKNSYDKITRKIKVVQTPEKGWKVDLKYTFSGNL